MEFDKVLLADLLQKAKGDRSINRFGYEADVDSGYISRILRCRLAKPPSAMILSKIAGKASNDVTIEQLMGAAGYLKSCPEPEIMEGRAIGKSEAGAVPFFFKEARERPSLLQVFEQLKELSDNKLQRVLKMIRMIKEMGD